MIFTEMIYDVIIIGSGVAGSTCAKTLVEKGCSTLVIERKALPRHKSCSGILSPRAWRFIQDNFGEIPKSSFSKPDYLAGVNFCFPNGMQMPVDFVESEAPQVWRKEFDYWLLLQSKAEIHDNTNFLNFEENPDYIKVNCISHDKNVSYRCKYLVGADGPFSNIVHQLYPEFRKRFPFVFVGQYFYDADLELAQNRFHFFVNPKLGYYSWCNKKDQFWNIGCAPLKPGRFLEFQRRVEEHLKKKHGLKIRRILHADGCYENGGMSATNHYLFGRGNVLVTGQAAGFLDFLGEGMTPSMISGKQAARAIITAQDTGQPLINLYEEMTMAERIHCSDTWNPLQLLSAKPLEADVKKAIMKLPAVDILYVLGGIAKLCKNYYGLGWGIPMIKAMLKRFLTGHY